MYWGVDVGSAYTKICGIDENKEIIDTKIIPTIINLDEKVKEYLSDKDVQIVISTGYGRHMIEETFLCSIVSEIKAHSKGACFFKKDTEMVIDLGAQDSKIILLDKNGNFIDFKINDKCAAGIGNFLKMTSNKLSLNLEEFSKIAFDADKKLSIKNICAVFAESEVISLITKKESASNISFAVNDSVASRLVSIAKKFSNKSESIVFTGGGALNSFLIHLLSKKLEKKAIVFPQSQFIGALGAALCGYEAWHNI